jgi:hypothetical protein
MIKIKIKIKFEKWSPFSTNVTTPITPPPMTPVRMLS